MTIVMRTPKDRLRHTLLFEFFLLLLCIPIMTFALGKPAEEVGAMSVMLSIAGASWNYMYNYLFDHALVRLNRPLYPRSGMLRIIHAVLFEITLLLITVPAVMLMLNFSFMKALMVDIGFAAFVPVYAFGYNMVYDRVFPPPVAEVA